MRCQVCRGPYHPATGDWDERWGRATCGPCHRNWWAYMKQHFSRKWGGGKRQGPSFYEAALTSIRAGAARRTIGP